MSAPVDITGQTFERLTAIRVVRRSNSKRLWLYRCTCGAEVVHGASVVRQGRVKSCGCLKRERATRHGGTNAPEYGCWLSMRSRCLCPSNVAAAYYSGRGITIAPCWSDFATFLADVGPRPSPEHSLDRIDNARGYEPGNVRWATKAEQGRNRRDNRLITFNGTTRCLAEWAEEMNLDEGTLFARLDAGWPIARALTQPARARTRFGAHDRAAFADLVTGGMPYADAAH